MAVGRQRDDNTATKWWCKLGLIISWFVGVGSALGGGICLYLELRDGDAVFFKLEHTFREMLPLGLNIVVTLLNDSMGYIHNCSLRWSLQREGKLDFSSNLRLLTSSRHSKPNAWYSNLIYLSGIVIAYSSTSLIFLSLNPQLAQTLNDSYPGKDANVGEIHVNAVALLVFGIGLLAQALITTWAFVATDIPTWSSNPLDVVRECMHQNEGNRIVHRSGRCMMSVHIAGEDRRNCRPISPQRSMFKAHHTVRWVFFLLVILPPLGGIWGGAICAIVLKGDVHGVLGRSWALLPVFTGYTDSNCPAHTCTDGTSILNVAWSAYSGAPGTLGSIFLITAFQAVVTLSLHCAELIVNLSRDEGVYRKLIGAKGTNGHYKSIVAAFSSWQTLLLFAFKAGVHWMFGLAINLSFRLGVNMYPPQIFYFTALALLVALFGMFLAFRRPKGHLPASYGHIQTIADVIDEWADSGCMFWGHKSHGWTQAAPSYAGTSTRRLEAPSEARLYGGCNELSPEELQWRLGYAAGSNQNLLGPGHAGATSPRGQRESRSSSRQSYGRPSHGSLFSEYSSQSAEPLLNRGY